MMWRLVSIHLLLLLQTFFCPGSLKPDEACVTKGHFGHFVYDGDYNDWQYYMWPYSHLSSKLEDALLNNKEVMNLMRQNFMITENVNIHFSVQLEVTDGTNLSSSCDINPYYLTNYTFYSFDTFCPSNSSDYKWKLCNIPEEYGFDSLEITYRSPYFSKIESEKEKYWIDVAIAWLSMLHGNILSMFYFVPDVVPEPLDYYYDGSDYLYVDTSVSLTLVMDRLDCNPSLPLTQCALSQLLSWVSELLADKGVFHKLQRK